MYFPIATERLCQEELIILRDLLTSQIWSFQGQQLYQKKIT